MIGYLLGLLGVMGLIWAIEYWTRPGKGGNVRAREHYLRNERSALRDRHTFEAINRPQIEASGAAWAARGAAERARQHANAERKRASACAAAVAADKAAWAAAFAAEAASDAADQDPGSAQQFAYAAIHFRKAAEVLAPAPLPRP